MERKTKQHKQVILLLACSAIFFESFDVSIVNLSLQSISSSIHVTLASTQWVQTVYLVSFGSFLLLGGRMCDHWGSKIIFLIGMFLFGISSLAASTCDGLGQLLFIRGIQGIGASLSMPAAIAIISLVFEEGTERNKAFGIFGAFAAIGFALALSLGGIITTYFDWHWIFSSTAPILFLVLLLGMKYLPAVVKDQDKKFNFSASILLVFSLLILCYGVHSISIRSFSWIVYILTGLSGAFVMLYYDRKSKNPFFDRAAISRINIRGQLSGFILGASFLGFVFIATLVLSDIFGMSNSNVGFLLLPFSILSALVSKVILPVLFRQFDVKGVVLISMFSLFAGTLILLIAATWKLYYLVLLALFLVNSCCIAIGYPSITILSLRGIKPEAQGMAAGIQSSLYTIGSSIGISFVSLFLTFKSEVSYYIPIVCSCVLFILFSMIAVKLLMEDNK